MGTNDHFPNEHPAFSTELEHKYYVQAYNHHGPSTENCNEIATILL
jgi:hypothetical protein